ncbi:MAG: DUF2490 domain-containing protein [Flavobacterium sp.]
MKNHAILLFLLLFPKVFWAQTTNEKTIEKRSQIWTSFVSTTKLNQHWDLVADAGMRWNNFFESGYFSYMRGALNYKINPGVFVGGGYMHGWSAPANPDWETLANENRIFEQVQLTSKLGNSTVVQRLRNEQRWQEKLVNDEVAETLRFTNRIRYQLNFNIPIFNDKKLPTIVTFDEIMVHYGKEVVFNTFDQNRFFIGIRQNINPKWSYDIGYLNIYQQKYSGYQYEMTHLLRLFVYLNTELKEKK